MPPKDYADPIMNDEPRFHSEARKFYPDTLIRSLPNQSLKTSRQVTPAQPLRSRIPRMGPPKCIYMHTIIDPIALPHGKGAVGRDAASPLGKNNKS
jgi:hypothetical protein